MLNLLVISNCFCSWTSWKQHLEKAATINADEVKLKYTNDKKLKCCFTTATLAVQDYLPRTKFAGAEKMSLYLPYVNDDPYNFSTKDRPSVRATTKELEVPRSYIPGTRYTYTR